MISYLLCMWKHMTSLGRTKASARVKDSGSPFFSEYLFRQSIPLKPSLELLVTVVLLVLPCGIGQAGAAANEDRDSVAIVSSVNGEARIVHPAGAQQEDQLKFRGPVIYGDHLSTAKDATLGLLVGQNSLLTIQELTEVRIAESMKNRQILEVAKGKVCLAVTRPREATGQPLMLKTPTSMITAAPGTLLSVDVETAPQKSEWKQGSGGSAIPVAMASPVAAQGTASVVETYHVVEGSVAIVSLAAGPSSLSLRTGQSLRVVGGVRGKPFVSPPVNCRAQEVQIMPVHTNTPAPAQRMIVQQQMQVVATAPVAVSAPVSAFVSSATPSTGTIPSDVQVPYTNTPAEDIPPPTVPITIRVTLPPVSSPPPPTNLVVQ